MNTAQRWLAIGACAGVALAAFSLVRGGAPPSSFAATEAPGDAIAIVNGQPISRESLARFTALLARERGRLELDADERRRVLARLVDEELLMQRGLALGLERREPSARSAILSAVVDVITTAESREPTREELEQTLRENAASFARPGRVTVEAARVPLEAAVAGEAARQAGRIADRARAGESMEAIARELGEPIDPPLPRGATTLDTLRDRVGTLVVQAVAKLAPGEVTAPVRAMDGYWVVKLVAREPDSAPPLEEVWDGVQQIWLQREHAAQLEQALVTLRDEARVEILDPDLRAEP
jgi:parvulin-like peptidyl-prolyl isomerase